jgi:hypothetical protein
MFGLFGLSSPQHAPRLPQFRIHIFAFAFTFKADQGLLTSAMNDATTSLLTEHFSYTPLVSIFTPRRLAHLRAG